MRITLLGSGTLRPDLLRGAPGYFLETGEETILVDCGSGTLRTLGRLGLPWGAITHVFLTHFHTDHVADLAPLLFAMKHGLPVSRTAPLTLVGPVGLRDHLMYLSLAHGSFVSEPGFPQVVTELEPDHLWRPESETLHVRTHSTRHSEGSLAYRFEKLGVSAGFTGDTGPHQGLGKFFQGVDLLVSECSHPDGGGRAGHLTPSQLADLMGRAHPELLVTVHAYPPLDPDEVPDLLKQAGYTGRALAGMDGMVIHLATGEVDVVASGW